MNKITKKEMGKSKVPKNDDSDFKKLIRILYKNEFEDCKPY